jgi:hypothetical protein
MEAMACKNGLQLAQQFGVQRIHLEMHCLELVKLWVMGDLQRSTIAPILKDVEELSS